MEGMANFAVSVHYLVSFDIFLSPVQGEGVERVRNQNKAGRVSVGGWPTLLGY